MKSFYLIIINLLLALPLFAQWNVYHPFPESGGEWNVSRQGYECSSCYDRYFFMEGDTLINNINYHQIKYKGWTGTYNQSAGYCDNWTYSDHIYYHGALRQDTSEKKVYFVPSGSGLEGILYDFSLSAGDHLPVGINNPFDAVIETVDLIMIDGIPRKIFHLAHDNIYFDVDIIEGIGSTTGLTEWFMNFECASWLYCFSENNYKLFPSPAGGICNLTVGPVQSEVIPKISISPNPSQGLFSIVTDTKPVSVIILNILGQELHSVLPDSKIITVDLRGLPEGMYYCQILFSDNTKRCMKLIISK